MSKYKSFRFQNRVIKFFKFKNDWRILFLCISFSIFSCGKINYGLAVIPFPTSFCHGDLKGWVSQLYFSNILLTVTWLTNHIYFGGFIYLDKNKEYLLLFIHENFRIHMGRNENLKCYIINTFSFSLPLLNKIQFSWNKKIIKYIKILFIDIVIYQFLMLSSTNTFSLNTNVTYFITILVSRKEKLSLDSFVIH